MRDDRRFPETEQDKEAALRAARSILARITSNKPSTRPLDCSEPIAKGAGIYIAITLPLKVFYVGKSSQLEQRCKLYNNEKLRESKREGATALCIEYVNNGLEWFIEQYLIDSLKPELNKTVSRWWIARSIQARRKPRHKYSTFRNRVKEFCSKRGIQLTDFSRTTEVSTSLVYSMAKDHRKLCDIGILEKMCNAYNVPISALMIRVPTEGKMRQSTPNVPEQTTTTDRPLP